MFVSLIGVACVLHCKKEN